MNSMKNIRCGCVACCDMHGWFTCCLEFWVFDCLGQVGLRKLLHAAVEEDVDVPQLRFALRKGKLLLTPKLVTQEILEGLLLLFLTL